MSQIEPGRSLLRTLVSLVADMGKSLRPFIYIYIYIYMYVIKLIDHPLYTPSANSLHESIIFETLHFRTKLPVI